MDHSTYAEPPSRFEAGTPAIAEAIALGAACDYLMNIGMDRVHEYETEIGAYLYKRLSEVDGVTIYGPTPEQGRASLCAFNVEARTVPLTRGLFHSPHPIVNHAAAAAFDFESSVVSKKKAKRKEKKACHHHQRLTGIEPRVMLPRCEALVKSSSE